MQVCELDIIFNFEKAYFILDEFLMGGEIQDTSKKSVLKAIEQADLLQEVCMHVIYVFLNVVCIEKSNNVTWILLFIYSQLLRALHIVSC